MEQHASGTREAGPAAAGILAHIRHHRSGMVELLRRLAEAESPSTVPEAQAGICDIIAAELGRLGYRVWRIPGRASGGMLYARPRVRRRRAPAQLLLGHYDTVWPLGTLADMPFEVHEDSVHGPGVYDMKGGLVQALLALETLRHFDVEPAVAPTCSSIRTRRSAAGTAAATSKCSPRTWTACSCWNLRSGPPAC